MGKGSFPGLIAWLSWIRRPPVSGTGEDEIIELGYLRIDGAGTVEMEEDELILLSPGRRLPPEIARLTGIEEETIRLRGVEKRQAAERFVRALSGPRVWWRPITPNLICASSIISFTAWAWRMRSGALAFWTCSRYTGTASLPPPADGRGGILRGGRGRRPPGPGGCENDPGGTPGYGTGRERPGAVHKPLRL